MLFSIRHATRYSYTPEAAGAAMRLKLFPPVCQGQMLQDWTVTVNGKTVTPLVTEATGDRIAQWHAHAPVETVEIVAEGTVETSDTAGVLKGLGPGAAPGVFLRETPLTKADEAIRAIGASVMADEPLPRLHALSDAVHTAVDYRSGATDAKTTAAEALARGAGVCQDQAHVFIAAARGLGVPARYVVGYLHDPDLGAPAEETHAWAEAHVPGLGWVGFDITNEICPTANYVRLACGLDADDAAPVRGTVLGDVREALAIDVAVAEASQSQSQSQ